MALTGKQIRQLRALSNQLKPALYIGKNGITGATVKQMSDSLEAHELVKCAVQDGCDLATREAGEQLARLTEADLVQVIGHRFVLYRETSREDVEKIELL